MPACRAVSRRSCAWPFASWTRTSRGRSAWRRWWRWLGRSILWRGTKRWEINKVAKLGDETIDHSLTHTLLSHLKWSSFSFLERGFRASRDAVQPTWSRLGRRNNGGGVSERLPGRWWTSLPPQNHVEGNVLADKRENRRCLYFFKILRKGIRQNQRISVREIMLLPRQRPKSPPMLLIRLILRRTFVTLCILFSDFF